MCHLCRQKTSATWSACNNILKTFSFPRGKVTFPVIIYPLLDSQIGILPIFSRFIVNNICTWKLDNAALFYA